MIKIWTIVVGALCATSTHAQNLADLVPLPMAQFVPMQQADGSRTWRFVVNPRGADEATIMSMLAGEMGKALWCGNGWEITSRVEAMKNVIIEGRCTAHQ